MRRRHSLVAAASATLVLLTGVGAVGAAPAPAATPMATPAVGTTSVTHAATSATADDVAMVAHIVSIDDAGTARIRVEVGTPSGYVSDAPWIFGEFHSVIGSGPDATGSITVTAAGDEVGTFTLGRSYAIVPVPGGHYGQELAVTYSGDSTYPPSTQTLTVFETPSQITFGVTSVTHESDGKYQIRGTVYFPATQHGTRMQLTELTLTWVAPGGERRTMQVEVDPTVRSTALGADLRRRTWVARGVELAHRPDSIDISSDVNRPYFDGMSSIDVDPVGLGVVNLGSELLVGYGKGPDGCPAEHTAHVTTSAVGSGDRLRSRAQTVPVTSLMRSCTLTLPLPHFDGPAWVRVSLDGVRDRGRVVPMTLAPIARQVLLDGTLGETERTIVARSAPAAVLTVLEQRQADGSWAEVTRSTREVPQFTVARTDSAATYRVRVPQDAAAAAATSSVVTVPALEPPRGAETGPTRAYTLWKTCDTAMRSLVAQSAGHWNGYRCTPRLVAWNTFWYGTPTYTP